MLECMTNVDFPQRVTTQTEVIALLLDSLVAEEDIIEVTKEEEKEVAIEAHKGVPIEAEKEVAIEEHPMKIWVCNRNAYEVISR